jgi:16S rRNA (guanine527-N7)-methyltransferase
VSFEPGFELQIREAFNGLAVGDLPERCYQQFSLYLGLLLRWNARLSLTAIREPDQIIRRHFAECAFLARNLPTGIQTLLDFGSGAGFPGIPIAICRPEIRITLAEAQGKKAAFLREALRTIGVQAEVFGGRVETMASTAVFDAVSLRAVERMADAILVALPRVRRCLVLLSTDSLAVSYPKLTPELEWHPWIKVPSSEQGVIAIGERSSAD